MTYDNKEEQLVEVKSRAEGEFYNLHPIDRAEAFGELSEWATHRCKVVEQVNARDGVPDRPENRPILDEVAE